MTTATKKSTEPKLLTALQARERLGMSNGEFYRLLPRLIASGMRKVILPSRAKGQVYVKFETASIDRMIQRAAETETPLC